MIGQACILVFDPAMNETLGFDISLEYQSVAGTALGGSDYLEIATPSEVVLQASPSSPDSPRRTCVPFFVFQDGINEPTESFTLILNVTEQHVIINPSVTEIFILDSDGMTNLNT